MPRVVPAATPCVIAIHAIAAPAIAQVEVTEARPTPACRGWAVMGWYQKVSIRVAGGRGRISIVCGSGRGGFRRLWRSNLELHRFRNARGLRIQRGLAGCGVLREERRW